MVGALAASCWDDDVEVLDLLSTGLGQPSSRRPVRRVAVYYHTLGTGGAERVTLDLAALWRSMGLEVLVICDEGRTANVALPAGASLATVPDAFVSDRERYATRGAALASVLEEFAPDCLVYGAWLSSTIAWDLLVCKSLGVPFVAFCHGSHRALTGWGDPRALRIPSIYRHVDAVMCLSRDDQEFWSSFNPHAFRTVNAADEAFLASGPAPLDGHRILCVGRIASDKSPVEALDVLREVRHHVPDATLEFVGPFGDYDRAWFEGQARDRGVLEAVSFRGGVPHDELPAVMREGSVLLLTSHFEGYPVTVAEAKACGLPCACYDLGYLTLLEGYRGVLCAPVGDVGGLARQVSSLLSDDHLRQRLGAEARAHARELANFDFEGLWLEVFATVSGDGLGAGEDRAGYLVSSMLREADRMVEEARRERDALHDELTSQRRLAADLKEQLDDVVGSVSFRIGRALTALPRHARDLLRRTRRA